MKTRIIDTAAPSAEIAAKLDAAGHVSETELTAALAECFRRLADSENGIKAPRIAESSSTTTSRRGER